MVEVNYLKTVWFFLREQEAGIYQDKMLMSMLMSETINLDIEGAWKIVSLKYDVSLNRDLFADGEEWNF